MRAFLAVSGRFGKRGGSPLDVASSGLKMKNKVTKAWKIKGGRSAGAHFRVIDSFPPGGLRGAGEGLQESPRSMEARDGRVDVKVTPNIGRPSYILDGLCAVPAS